MALKDEDKLAHLRLARSHSIGPVTFRNLISDYGNAQTAINALLDGKYAKKVASIDAIQRELAQCRKQGIQTLYWGDGHYPNWLAATDDAPPILHYLGNIELLAKPGVAIVGARNASASGLKITRSLASDLGKAGEIVVSGLARGIDTAAHTSALSTGTIACLAGGPDVIYPRENTELYSSIRQGGLIVSEMPPGTQPQARHFPKRNRIISGLARGVIIIEAAARSGSLITARLAAEQGRDIFAVPGSPLDPRSYGCNQLLKDGAILVRDVDDILAELPATVRNEPLQTVIPVTKPMQQNSTPTANLSSATNSLINILSPTPTHIDEIVRLAGKPAEVILGELQMLELEGEIHRHSGARFSRIV
jgi:DNA processing protein